ncbi:MAG: rod-binding protein [Bacillota bacterium]|nr:rod-binding protein [Bacillota bacterium]
MRVGNAGTCAQATALHRAQTPRLPATGTKTVDGSTGAARARARARAGARARATASVGARTDAELRKACEELESVFLEQLLKEMRRTVPKDDLFGGGRGEDVFQSMFDQEIAKKMAGRGGIGLAEILVRQLSRQAVPPSRLGGHRLGNPTGANGLAED